MKRYQLIRQAGRLVNRRTLRLFAILGTVTAVSAAVMSALGAILVVRQLQLVSAQRKALPVIRQAAERYLQLNAPEEPVQRKKRFFAPEGKGNEEEAPEEAVIRF